MKFIFILVYLINLFDLAMTYRLYHQYGIGIEGNPIGRYLLSSNLAIPVKVCGVGACLIALYVGTKRYPNWKWTSWLVLAVYSLLAVYHIIIGGLIW